MSSFIVVLSISLVQAGLFSFFDTRCRNLIDASKSGDLNVVEAMIRKGVDVNCRNDKGQTSLMISSENMQSLIVKKLLSFGADCNAQDTHFGWTPLMFALKGYWFDLQIEKSHHHGPEIINSLLFHKGCDVNIRSFKHMHAASALHLASAYGLVDIVKMIVEHKERLHADINIKNQYGNTPIMYAAQSEHQKYHVVNYLKGAKVDLSVVNNFGNTLFDIMGAHDEVSMDLLLHNYMIDMNQ